MGLYLCLVSTHISDPGLHASLKSTPSVWQWVESLALIQLILSFDSKTELFWRMPGAQETGSWREVPIPLSVFHFLQSGNLQMLLFWHRPGSPLKPAPVGGSHLSSFCVEAPSLELIPYSLSGGKGTSWKQTLIYLFAVALLYPTDLLLEFSEHFVKFCLNRKLGFKKLSFFFFFLVLYFSFQRKSIHLANKTNDSCDVQARCRIPYSPWYPSLIEWGRSV